MALNTLANRDGVTEMTTKNQHTYPNNQETKRSLGWEFCLEYCYGDRANSKFVTHNWSKGTFTFHD